MSKTNSLNKFLKNINYSINNLLEKNLNKLKFQNLIKLARSTKIILTFVALLIISLSYLVIPSFFSKDQISKELKNKLSKKLNLNFKLSNNLNYNLFPRPHFKIKNANIFIENDNISEIKELNIYLSISSLFSLDDIKIKDVKINKANFNLNKKTYAFFSNLLENEFANGSFKIKNSNIFFKNSENDVLFINKILNMKYYYDTKDQKNISYSDNEIFNIPYSLEILKNRNQNKVFSKVKMNILKLQFENEINFHKDNKIGKTEIIFNKLKSLATYKINDKFFSFNYYNKYENSKFFYKGLFNIKPFYSNVEGQTEELNLSYFLDSNAMVLQLLKTEIFNNKNIEFQSNVFAKRILNNLNFINLNLKSKIKDGLIDLDDTSFEWKNFVNFKIIDSLIFVKDGELILGGQLKVNISDYNEVYKYLLTPKKFRKKIQKINLNFSYNFDQKSISLSNIKVDDKFDQKLNKDITGFDFKDSNLKNKIYLKNLLNDAIKSYFG
ncbi:AsmA family protein [Candidatus Pelagibacter sp. HIMB123]|uniref:AsmA family protein n=1 Tax=Candidatus Pelagibacter sp. HIMB123 TaxID=3415413 RepID=UPI003F82819B